MACGRVGVFTQHKVQRTGSAQIWWCEAEPRASARTSNTSEECQVIPERSGGWRFPAYQATFSVYTETCETCEGLQTGVKHVKSKLWWLRIVVWAIKSSKGYRNKTGDNWTESRWSSRKMTSWWIIIHSHCQHIIKTASVTALPRLKSLEFDGLRL